MTNGTNTKDRRRKRWNKNFRKFLDFMYLNIFIRVWTVKIDWEFCLKAEKRENQRQSTDLSDSLVIYKIWNFVSSPDMNMNILPRRTKRCIKVDPSHRSVKTNRKTGFILSSLSASIHLCVSVLRSPEEYSAVRVETNEWYGSRGKRELIRAARSDDCRKRSERRKQRARRRQQQQQQHR